MSSVYLTKDGQFTMYFHVGKFNYERFMSDKWMSKLLVVLLHQMWQSSVNLVSKQSWFSMFSLHATIPSDWLAIPQLSPAILSLNLYLVWLQPNHICDTGLGWAVIGIQWTVDYYCQTWLDHLDWAFTALAGKHPWCMILAIKVNTFVQIMLCSI